MTPLTPAELSAALAALPAWTHQDGALHRTLRFGSFRAAIAFFAACAPDIEALDHHPEWSNVYDRIVIRLTSHSAGDLVTVHDIELARLIDRHVARTPVANV